MSFLRKQESIELEAVDSRFRGNDKSGRRKPSQLGAIVGLMLLSVFLPAPALAAPASPVDSGTLVEHPNLYDGRVITFTGEVIGDLMERSDGVWLSINDDAYSRQEQERKLAGFNSGQSVLVESKGLVRVIKRLGDYNNRGDIVTVEGVFHKACPDHGGDMMIHANSLSLVKRGFALPHPISARKLSLAITWLAISGVVLALWKWRTTAMRR